MKTQRLLLQITIAILFISSFLALRGITFAGEPQTWAYKYGWQTLAFVVIASTGLALVFRKNEKNLSNWVLGLSAALLIANVIIAYLFGV